MKDKIELLNDFRTFLANEKVDLFVVSATDEYLNEYVSPEDNSRFLLTGFSGSSGNALVTQEKVFLFVDGRYHLQAEKETNPEHVEVVKVGLDKSPQKALYEKLAELSAEGTKVGIVSSKISCAGYKELLKTLAETKNVKSLEYKEDPLQRMTETQQRQGDSKKLRYMPIEISGKTPAQKLAEVKDFNKKNDIDLLLVTNLQNVAYLTNLRGMEISYSSCFNSKALIFRDKAYIFADLEKLPSDITGNFGEDFIFKNENELDEFIETVLTQQKVANVYYHPNSTSLSMLRKIEKLSENVIEIKESIISTMQAVKNPSELEHFRECYLKTDIVFSRSITWLNQSLEKGMQVSEKDFSDRVKRYFYEEGAYGLSFEAITASGKNSAFIHYSTPDDRKFIEAGELVLLDCGGYFEGGYATDQTRTFLAGEKNVQDWQKQVYTAVMKGFLRGINLETTENTTGFDLDNAVRKVVEASKPEGFEFSHATGHGVGISVHEAPPRIGPSESSKTPLKTGMVFTVEPGLYNENLGGVRIENTVTIVEEDGKRFIRTLTRVSLDENLIDYGMLDDVEKNWLEEYRKLKIG